MNLARGDLSIVMSSIFWHGSCNP